MNEDATYNANHLDDAADDRQHEFRTGKLEVALDVEAKLRFGV